MQLLSHSGSCFLFNCGDRSSGSVMAEYRFRFHVNHCCGRFRPFRCSSRVQPRIHRGMLSCRYVWCAARRPSINLLLSCVIASSSTEHLSRTGRGIPLPPFVPCIIRQWVSLVKPTIRDQSAYAWMHSTRLGWLEKWRSNFFYVILLLVAFKTALFRKNSFKSLFLGIILFFGVWNFFRTFSIFRKFFKKKFISKKNSENKKNSESTSWCNRE